MAQANFTPIQLYRSTTASAAPTAGNLADGELAINTNDGKLYYKDSGGAVQLIASKAGASGDVVGPASATDNAVVRFDGTTGKLVQNSVVTIADSTGDISGVGQLNATTVDTTNLEVTNIKAIDGTAAASIANSTGVVTVTAAPVMSALTASQAVFTTAGKALTSNAITGTGNVVMSNAPTLTGTISAAAATLSGNLTLSGGTANGVLYLNGSKVATSGSALVFDGTNLGIGTSSPGLKLDVVGVIRASVASGNSAININNSSLTGKAWDLLPNTSSGESDLLWYYGGASAGTRMTLTNSGNLGLGVTPSAWAVYKSFDSGSCSFNTAGVQGELTSNGFFNSSSAWIYKANGFANRYVQNLSATGAHAWFNAPSGTAGNAITFTQAMTLDASGNLGIGTTSPANLLHVNGSNSIARFSGASTSLSAYQTFFNNSAAQAYFGIESSTGTGIIGSGAAYGMVLATGSTNPLVFGTNNAERARITSGGSFCVHDGTVVDLALVTFAKTTETSPVLVIKNPQYSCDMWSTNTSGDNVWVRFFSETSATQRGSIAYNRAGGVVAYNTTSDYRAKDILGPVTDTGTTIDALKVYNGKMKGATQSRPMLVAHEAQEVAPYAVTGEKDAVNDDGAPKYQQMDVSSFVPLLIAEIQSLRQRVAQLEGA